MSNIQKKHGSILAFASLAVLAFVLLITQSIYMNAFKDIIGKGNHEAVAGVTFAVLAIISLGGAFYFFHVKDDNKLGFIALGVALLFIIISFAVPISSQDDINTLYKLNPKHFVGAAKAAANVFLPNVIFFSLGLVGASIGTGIYFLVD